MTAATTYLRQRQQKHPLPGPDRAQQIYGVLEPHLPQSLRNLVASESVAVGTIGMTLPTVYTVPITPDGHVIEFSTGLMDFVYAVSRALAAGNTVTEQDDVTQSAPLQLPDVAARIAKVYRAWTRYHRWPWRALPFLRPRIDRFDFAITQSGHKIAENVATRAEAFMLAHECGHVLIDRKLVADDPRNEETRADEIGLGLFLPTDHSRMGVAGAVWAIRILAGLQRSGFQFASHYPSPDQRMESLFRVLRTLSPTDRYVDEISTIAVAHASFIDEAERLLFGPQAVSPRYERQTRITLIALLEEMMRGRITPARGCADFAATASAVGAATRAAAFDVLVRYYLLEVLTVEGYLPQSEALQMGGTLLGIVDQLPPAIKKDLQAALNKIPAAGPPPQPRP